MFIWILKEECVQVGDPQTSLLFSIWVKVPFKTPWKGSQLPPPPAPWTALFAHALPGWQGFTGSPGNHTKFAPFELFCFLLRFFTTVDMVNIPLFIGFHTSQVVISAINSRVSMEVSN